MRVFGMHDASGCGYYRITMPLAELGRHGHDVRLVLGSDVKASTAASWPLIVGQRVDKHEALPSWRRFRARSRLVYEIDDDVFNVEPVNWQAYGVYSRREVQDAVMHCAETADLVTVTTEPLAQVMRQFNGNVAVLPNHVPGWVCDHPRPRRDRPVAGWQGGASHGADMGLIARPLRKFLDRFPGWDAHLLGTDYRPTVRHEHARFTEWVNIGEDPAAYYGAIDFDIGLAPLVPSVFSDSKSAIKALEYAALGIPVIASDTPAYRGFVIHGVTGFLVRYDHEWLKYLSELAADEGLRESMGAKARDAAREFTIENGWQLWEDAYKGLCS
jgi:glycosyltransferase involved in cell wall biosynthesis